MLLSLLFPLFIALLLTRRRVRMTDFVRRIVSGNKSRYRDEELDLELGASILCARSTTYRSFCNFEQTWRISQIE